VSPVVDEVVAEATRDTVAVANTTKPLLLLHPLLRSPLLVSSTRSFK